MGKLFGISDLPVSTIMTPFEPVVVPPPQVRELPKHNFLLGPTKDVVDLPKAPNKKSFISMRNGIGKLMKHFSKVK